MKRITALLVFMTFFGMKANATTWHSGEVSSIYPDGSGEVILTFVNPPTTCIRVDKYLTLKVGQAGVTEQGLDRMLSVLLAASFSGKDLTVNFDPNTPGCYINRLFVTP